MDGAQIRALAADEPHAHGQTQRDARAREKQRGGAGGARGDPEQVRRGVDGDRHARTASATTSWLPSSWTRTPPYGSHAAASSWPLSSAALAQNSAKAAVDANAVAWTRPVYAGWPVDGSSR